MAEYLYDEVTVDGKNYICVKIDADVLNDNAKGVEIEGILKKHFVNSSVLLVFPNNLGRVDRLIDNKGLLTSEQFIRLQAIFLDWKTVNL